jgi:hypothetical protein
VSQRRGAVALLRVPRNRASTSPQTSTAASATNISDRLVLNPSMTDGALSLMFCQLKNVSMNCSIAAALPGPRQSGISGTAACSAKYCWNSLSRVPSSTMDLMAVLNASRFLESRLTTAP